MPHGWPPKIDRWEVEWDEIPRPDGAPFIPLTSTPSGCLHTTEGFNVDSAIAGNRDDGFGAHLYIGNDRIVACRPIDKQASSLRGGATNHRFIQIEAVMRLGAPNSDISPPATSSHLMKAGTIEPLVATMRWLRDNLDIPLSRPAAWKDDCSDMPLPWAKTTNTRRESGLAMKHHGWVGHVEVPENDHYDPGKFRWTEAFRLAEEGEDDVSLAEYVKGQQGYQIAFKERGGDPGGPPEDSEQLFRAGWRDARFAANAGSVPDAGLRGAAGAGLTEEQQETLADVKTFIDELREQLGKLQDPDAPANTTAAARRIAKAVLSSEGDDSDGG